MQISEWIVTLWNSSKLAWIKAWNELDCIEDNYLGLTETDNGKHHGVYENINTDEYNELSILSNIMNIMFVTK